MNKYIQLRKIAEVFHIYGISLAGKNRHINLYNDLKMQHLFVVGLIFELELVSQKELDDIHVSSVETPCQIIEKLV
ncbi:hypothetical protein GCM10011506_25860 [Marivirga lumbricoides]|uniref:Acyl carrier protein n=1 Tax=Marivirga lumbricoides TaxID=1046115 RepID=A0ABQ1MHR0_9BACT|nr:hypothetical protein GCM10011506_25860 [Marivirga lumbricoides]